MLGGGSYSFVVAINQIPPAPPLLIKNERSLMDNNKPKADIHNFMVLYNYYNCTTRLFNDIKILHLYAKLTKDTLALGNLFSTLKALRYNSYCKTEKHTNIFNKMIIEHIFMHLHVHVPG